MESFDRNNRNRRGGHKTLMPINHRFGNEFMYCTPVEKKLIKRLSKKKVRRQWQATQAQVQREMNNDWTWQDECQEIEEQLAYEDWYDDEPMEESYEGDDGWYVDPVDTSNWYEEQGYSAADFFGYEDATDF